MLNNALEGGQVMGTRYRRYHLEIGTKRSSSSVGSSIIGVGTMSITPEALAFATLIGGQFAAVIAMASVKRRFYPNENGELPSQSSKAELDRFHPARPLGQWLIGS